MIFLPQFINEGIYKERIPTINYLFIPRVKMGFPGNSAGKETACNAGDPGLIPWWRSSPVEGISYPLQYSCLENPHRQRSLIGSSSCKESDTTEWLSTHTHSKNITWSWYNIFCDVLLNLVNILLVYLSLCS